MWYILQMFRKVGLSTTIALEYDLSYILSKDGISFSPKIWYFFTDEKWKMIFLKKYKEIWCFLYVGKASISFSYKYEKSQDDLFLKNTPKDDISSITEKDDIHSRKDDIDILCTFTDTFLSVFILLLSNKKKGNLIYRVEIWLYL